MIEPAIPQALRGCWTVPSTQQGEPSRALEVRATRVFLDGIEGYISRYRGSGRTWVESNFVAMPTRETLISRLELGNGANGARPGELLVSDGNAVMHIYVECEAAG